MAGDELLRAGDRGVFCGLAAGNRLHTGRGTAWTWLIAGVPTLGLTLWAVHFTALLAVRLPMRPPFDLPLTLLSIEPAILATAVVLWLGREGHLRGARLLGAVVALAAGVTATRYFGLAAVRITQYDWLTFSISIAVVAAVAYAALQHAGRWIVGASSPRKIGVAGIVGAAVCAAHYLGMAAARFEPNAFANTLAASADHVLLGYTVGCGTVIMLIALSVSVLLHARSTLSPRLSA